MKRHLFFIAFLLFLAPGQGYAQKKGQDLIDSLTQELSKGQETKKGKHSKKVDDNKNSTALILGSIAMAYNVQNEYSKAIEYYSRALKIYEHTNNKNSIARILGNIGHSYLSIAEDSTTSQAEKLTPAAKRANLYKATDFLTRSIALSKENGYLDVLKTFSKDLSEAQAVSNYKEALDNYRRANSADAVPDTESDVKITNLEMKRQQELQSKQAEIDRMDAAHKRLERMYFIGGLVALLVVIAIMFRDYTKQKATNRLLSSEKKKSEDLLLNILPAQIAEELKEKGMSHAQQFDDVTVIITDFVSFTTVAERFSPKQLVGELHACFKSFDGMLEKYNIEKIKTVGDAYLAVSGLPVANPNHAADAVAIAIQMRDFMLYRKTQLGDATFEMRIGVHTGSVVAGIVGVKKFAYDIWGDNVNIAARLEQNCEPGKINISQTTYELVRDKFDCEYRGEISAKKKGKLKMYFVNDKIKKQ